MRKQIEDAIIFGFIGLMVGTVVGAIIASSYAVINQGGSFNDVEGFEIFDYSPWVVGQLQEPFKTGLIIIGSTTLVCMVGFIALSYRPHLSSHGSAKWASKDTLKRAGLAVPLKYLSGPIYAKLGSPKSRGEFITSKDIPHSLICAPTGSGKGVGIVVPTLLTYAGSVICLDLSRFGSVSLNWIMSIKENYYGTSPHRRIPSRSCPHCIDERPYT